LIQKEEIEKKIKELNDKKVFGSKIVTEVAELKEFYAAE
jgi:peptide methionine sulfoxide reductase MsrA